MPVIRLTELALDKLKSKGTQTRFYDSALANFGVLVGKKRKTFFVMTGTERKFAAIGKYPSLSLKAARGKALSIMDGTFALQAAQDPETRISEYVRQLQASQRHKYEQERLLRAHLLPKTSNLATLTKKDVLAITDCLASSPSSQLHCHRAIKAFLNWGAERDYITTNPMNGISSPGSDRSRDRLLSTEE